MMANERVIYINGNFVSASEAKVSVYDHGLLYGDGVFEGIRAYEGYVFRLNEHIDRLYESAKSIDLKVPLTKEETKEAVLDVLRKNRLVDAYVRLVVTRGVGTLGLDPKSCHKPSMIIIADHLPLLLGGKPVRAITSSVRRNTSATINPMIKSLNYLNNIMAKIEANRMKVNEAVMLNIRGTISEGTADNLFIVKNGKIMTPPSSADILVGITRNTVLSLANKKGIEVREEEMTLHELYNADEAFFTGTATEIVPISEVDGRTIGNGKPGPITRDLIKRFRKIRRSGTPINSQ